MKTLNTDHVASAVSHAAGLYLADIRDTTRKGGTITAARRALATIFREDAGLSWPQAAKAMGLRSHATVFALARDFSHDAEAQEIAAKARARLAAEGNK